MSENEIENYLTCTRCHVVQEYCCNIVYSQGNRVCVDCKKKSQSSDNKEFDNYMNRNRGNYWREV